MAFNITIGPSPNGSDRSSLSDEEDSSGVQVSPPSDAGSHDYHDPYDEWAHLPYPDELKPSDSASRPTTSHRARNRHPIHGSSSGARRSGRRHIAQERDSFTRRPRRHPSPESPESIDSADEYGPPYARASQDRRFWPPVPQGASYAHSSSAGPPPYGYPSVPAQHGSLMHPNAPHTPSDQLVRLGHQNQLSQAPPYGHSLYPYSSQMQQTNGPSMPPFFVQEHHPGHHVHPAASSHTRSDGHSTSQHAMGHGFPAHGPYGGSPLGTHELVPYGTGNYYPFRDPYSMIPGMLPSYFNNYPRPPSPNQLEPSGSPAPPPPADAAKDEAISRLEKLIMEERTEREARDAREATRLAAIEREAAEQAAREEQSAREKQIAEDAATNARLEAEQKAADEAAKAKKEAEEAAAAAAAEATEAANKAAAEAAEAANKAAAEALAAATSQIPDKKKPIKFKDAVGRKFSFPFDLCCTWKGMEDLIRQAFLHIEVIGPHVAEGHYDLIGPNGDIILPQVWETVIEPDWTVTMHMWPIPEKPKTPEPTPPAEGVPDAPESSAAPGEVAPAGGDESKKKAEGLKKARPKAPDPGAFAMWMVGSNRMKFNKALKAGKKPEVVQQHGNACRVM